MNVNNVGCVRLHEKVHEAFIVGVSGTNAFTHAPDLDGSSFTDGDIVFDHLDFSSSSIASSPFHMRNFPLRPDAEMRDKLREEYPTIDKAMKNQVPFRNTSLTNSSHCFIAPPPQDGSDCSTRLALPILLPLVNGHNIVAHKPIKLVDITPESLFEAFKMAGAPDATWLTSDIYFQWWVKSGNAAHQIFYSKLHHSPRYLLLASYRTLHRGSGYRSSHRRRSTLNPLY